MKTPDEVLDIMDQVRQETRSYLDDLSQEQLDWRPPQGGEGETEWSLGEVFMHLGIDEFYLRELIARPLLEGLKPPEGITFLPPPPPYGAQKEVIVFWLDRARLQTHRYFQDWPADANLELIHVGDLEAMNGLEWFEGYAGHEAFHHRQIKHLLGQLPG